MPVDAYLNGISITSLVQEGSVTHQLNQPSFATVRVPLDRVSGDWMGAKLKIVLPSGALDFHGQVVLVDDQGDEDEMWRVATFADPTFIFAYRPARDADGDFSKPAFIQAKKYGPQIVQEIIQNSITYEGAMGISLGSFATGGVDLSGAPADWPMTIAQVIALLVETGELDVVCVPVDDGQNMGQVSAYNGNYGADRSGSVSFEYATGAHNARACRVSRDARELMNKLWIYGGPRVKSIADPAGDQHWAFNVTGDDPGLPNPPQSTIAAAISASRATWYQRMEIRIFDGDGAAALRELYRRWWQMESWLRARPRTLVHVTPQRGIAPSFGVGDLISVAAGSRFGGGFSGVQRVMEFSYRWDADGVIELGEPLGQALAGRPAVVTSADAEGI
jgi:hypothetical protein